MTYKTAKELYVGIRYQVNDTRWVVDKITIKDNLATVYASKEDGTFGYSVTLPLTVASFLTV